jgi:hypothetical protein
MPESERNRPDEGETEDFVRSMVDAMTASAEEENPAAATPAPDAAYYLEPDIPPEPAKPARGPVESEEPGLATGGPGLT